MPDITKIIAPAGTGKTTRLLSIVEDLFASGTKPEQIIYTTFTRAGAGEAVKRGLQKGYKEHEMPFFRTLHSFCLRFIGRREILRFKDYVEFANSAGVRLTLSPVDSFNGQQRGQTRGDHLMAVSALSRAWTCSVEQAWAKYEDSHMFSIQEAVFFHDSYMMFKRSRGRIDFTDMLELFLNDPPNLRIDNVIVDEAQDLSLLQWGVVDILAANAKRVWVAGDDDQCIHEWAGADPNKLIDLDAAVEIQPQSYRIPRKVHTFANIIVKKVSKRIDKEYRPRDVEGELTLNAHLEDIDMDKGTWLLLVRNNCFLDYFTEELIRKGHLFTAQGDYAEMDKTVRAVKTWNDLRKGFSVTVEEAALCYNLMSQRDRVTRGFKKQLFELDKDHIVDIELLRERYGLVFDGEWAQAFDMMSDRIRSYIQACERRGEDLSKPVRIEVSTIHGSKGREAENVVVLHDMTWKTHNMFLKKPDAEHRVAYVACTRAKEHLFIMQPLTERFYPYPYYENEVIAMQERGEG